MEVYTHTKKAGIITFIGRVNEDIKDTDDAGKHKGKRLLRKEMIWMCNNFEDTFLLCVNLFSLFTLVFGFFLIEGILWSQTKGPINFSYIWKALLDFQELLMLSQEILCSNDRTLSTWPKLTMGSQSPVYFINRHRFQIGIKIRVLPSFMGLKFSWERNKAPAWPYTYQSCLLQGLYSHLTVLTCTSPQRLACGCTLWEEKQHFQDIHVLVNRFVPFLNKEVPQELQLLGN